LIANKSEWRGLLLDCSTHAGREFAGGLLGHLDKGGKFEVRQAEVAAGLWEMIDMCVDMKGKALFFKTITAQETEHRSNFYRVPDDLTLAEAAAMPNKEVV